MTKLLEKPILRTLPIFYAQATATPLRKVNFAWMLLLGIVGCVLTAAEAPSLMSGLAIFMLNLFGVLLFLALTAMIWDWLARFLGSTRN